MSRRNEPALARNNAQLPKRSGLQAVAIIEAVKGILAILAASGLELLGPAPIQHAIQALIVRFQFDPDHGALATFSQAVSPGSVRLAAAAVLAYGLIQLVEAWGLWRARAWASWLGCVTAALYLPLDLYELVRHPGWEAMAVLAINLLVIAVLVRDLLRRR